MDDNNFPIAFSHTSQNFKKYTTFLTIENFIFELHKIASTNDTLNMEFSPEAR